MAGVLAAAVVAWTVLPPDPDGWGAARGLAALLGCIALLVGADVVSWWNSRRK